MLYFLYSNEKTNSYRPTPWALTLEPFAAFRGNGARYRVFCAVSPLLIDAVRAAQPDKATDGYRCPRVWQVDVRCRLIKTRKGANMVVPARQNEKAEDLYFLTLRGGFRGGYIFRESRDLEGVVSQAGNVHCCPTLHVLARATGPKPRLVAETGRRCSRGIIEVFGPEGYSVMRTQEFLESEGVGEQAEA